MVRDPIVRPNLKKVHSIETFLKVIRGKETFIWTPEFKEEIKEDKEESKQLSEEFFRQLPGSLPYLL